MKNFFLNLMDKGFFSIGLALGAGILVMVGVIQAYDYLWGTGPTEAVVKNPVERALISGAVEGPVQTLHIRRVPGPFLGRDGSKILGFVFLDVAVEIAGEEQFSAASENLDTLMARFSEHLKTTGVGRSDLPGEVDYDRLAKTFLTMARDEVSLRGIQSVRVSEAEEG